VPFHDDPGVGTFGLTEQPLEGPRIDPAVTVVEREFSVA
jgi:hypothetical protein